MAGSFFYNRSLDIVVAYNYIQQSLHIMENTKKILRKEVLFKFLTVKANTGLLFLPLAVLMVLLIGLTACMEFHPCTTRK